MNIQDPPTLPFDRRERERRVNTLAEKVAVLEQKMDENTEVTKEVRDILGTFRVTMSVAKWVAAIASAVAAVVAIIKGMRP